MSSARWYHTVKVTDEGENTKVRVGIRIPNEDLLALAARVLTDCDYWKPRPYLLDDVRRYIGSLDFRNTLPFEGMGTDHELAIIVTCPSDEPIQNFKDQLESDTYSRAASSILGLKDSSVLDMAVASVLDA